MYQQLGKEALEHGDPTTANLYWEINKDEVKHIDLLEKRIAEVLKTKVTA